MTGLISKDWYEYQRAHLWFELCGTRSLVKEKQLRKQIEELENQWYIQEEAKHAKKEND